MPPCLTDGSPRISTKELWFFDTVSVSVVKYVSVFILILIPWYRLLTVASSDEVGDSARLEEGAELAPRVEHVHKLDHLHETESYDGRLRIVAESQPIHEASAHRHDVLRMGVT